MRMTLAIAFALAAPAAAQDKVVPIAFAPGQSSASVSGILVRGDAALYSFAAKAGQSADVRIGAIEDNASFVIYRPPSKVRKGSDGLDVDGAMLLGGDKTVPALAAGAEKHWAGKLPASGTYYVLIAGDRGNARYTLTVAIN